MLVSAAYDATQEPKVALFSLLDAEAIRQPVPQGGSPLQLEHILQLGKELPRGHAIRCRATAVW
jgi:hypothetical protein